MRTHTTQSTHILDAARLVRAPSSPAGERLGPSEVELVQAAFTVALSKAVDGLGEAGLTPAAYRKVGGVWELQTLVDLLRACDDVHTGVFQGKAATGIGCRWPGDRNDWLIGISVTNDAARSASALERHVREISDCTEKQLLRALSAGELDSTRARARLSELSRPLPGPVLDRLIDRMRLSEVRAKDAADTAANVAQQRALRRVIGG